MEETSTRIAVALAASLVAASLPGVSSAQGDDMTRAKECFSQGQAAFDDGRYEEARAAFEESLAAFPHFRTLFNIGLCAEKLGDVAGAIDMYQRYVDWPSEVPNREEVKAKLAALRATLPAGPEPPAAVAEEPPPEEKPAPAPAPPAGEPRAPDLRVPGWIAVGTGAAGVVVGAVFLGLAAKKSGEMEGIDGETYDPDVHDALPEDGERYEKIGWAVGGVGVAVAATGAILLIASKRGGDGGSAPAKRQGVALVPGASSQRAALGVRWSF